jgi:transcriptional regulator with PAS, ATPase and Fis domain
LTENLPNRSSNLAIDKSWNKPSNVQRGNIVFASAKDLPSIICVNGGRKMKHESGITKGERSGLLAHIEKAASLKSLAPNSGDRKASAEELGISLHTLQYRLKGYVIAGRD